MTNAPAAEGCRAFSRRALERDAAYIGMRSIRYL